MFISRKLTFAAFAAALAAPTLARAEAPGEPPRLELRHHRRAALPSSGMFETGTFEVEGRLLRGGDGTLVLALPLRESSRRRIARAQGVPLQKVPRDVRRALRLAPGGIAEASVDLRVGKEVRAVLTRDRSGRTFVVDLLSPR